MQTLICRNTATISGAEEISREHDSWEALAITIMSNRLDPEWKLERLGKTAWLLNKGNF
ncbi:MAG: hypothetical protein GY774_09525 [Planctomycetes bacterium]|nr:hypothetical protein [Planctomycetota bacterium]